MNPEPVEWRSLWNYDDPKASEERFRSVLDQCRSTALLGSECEVLTQIARAQGLQRNFDAARDTLRGVRDLLDETTSRARILYLLELGRVENSSGNPEASKIHFLEAYRLGVEEHEDFLAIDAAHMLGIVEIGDQSLEWNERAILDAEQTTDPVARGWLGSLYNNTGWTYHNLGKFERAMHMFRRALDFRLEQRGSERNILIARWCVARCLRSLGRLEEALADQHALEEENHALGIEPGFVYEEIAECLTALDRMDEARPYFAKAHEVLSKDPWLTPDRIERLKLLAGVNAVS